MILEIKQDSDPVLRIPAATIETFDDDLKRLLGDMHDTMYHYNGLGIAAPQVGVSKAAIVLSFEPYMLINPTIESQSGKQVGDEGCLSFPGLYLEVSRATSATISFQDMEGVTHKRTFTGLQARCVLHEIDHLNGIVFTTKVKQTALLLAKKKSKNRVR